MAGSVVEWLDCSITRLARERQQYWWTAWCLMWLAIGQHRGLRAYHYEERSDELLRYTFSCNMTRHV